MISSIAWIPKGIANPNPQKYELSATERELLQSLPPEALDDHGPTVSATRKTVKLPLMENHLPSDLRMDEYSSDDDDSVTNTAAMGRLLVGNDPEMQEDDEEEDDDAALHVTDKAEHGEHDENDDSDDDLADVPDTREFEPINLSGMQAMGISHVGMNGNALFNPDDDGDNSEADDVALSPDDALIVVAKTEDDFASLEVYVYDQKIGNLFVHHDIPLPAFPLCLAHGQVSANATPGNFCAVGTFNPGIEIWNLDVLNALEPSCVLGGEDTSRADELMKMHIRNATHRSSAPPPPLPSPSEGGLRPGSHTDAVMSLSWNSIHKQVIASGSADHTVKLWDVTKAGETEASTLTHHKGKVAAVMWNPEEGTLLATGSFDRTVAILDARSPQNIKTVRITADCETLAWDPTRTQYLTVASEDGTVACWDVRKFQTSTPVWSMVASEFGGITDLSYNSHVPGLMVTCSIDKTITLWDVHSNRTDEKAPPKACGSKDMCVGKLYSVGFYPSTPWLLACGGSGNELALWDLSEEEMIQEHFRGRPFHSHNSQSEAEGHVPVDHSLSGMMQSGPHDATSKSEGENPTETRVNKKAKGKSKRKAHRKT